MNDNIKKTIAYFIIEGYINSSASCPSCNGKNALFEYDTNNRIGKIRCPKCKDKIMELQTNEITDDFNSKVGKISEILKRYEVDNFKLHTYNNSSLQGFGPMKDTLISSFTLGNDVSYLKFEYDYCNGDIHAINLLKSKFHPRGKGDRHTLQFSNFESFVDNCIKQWRFENET